MTPRNWRGPLEIQVGCDDEEVKVEISTTPSGKQAIYDLAEAVNATRPDYAPWINVYLNGELVVDASKAERKSA